MEKLFVDKTVTIDAPAAKVWEVLTRTEYADHWVSDFSGGEGPRMHIESDWKLGSDVLWKAEDGTLVVEGKVTALEPDTLLRFTVFDVRMERPPVTKEDGITFELSEQAGKTTLHILHGNFAAMAEGEKFYKLTLPVWERVLPTIKMLAEGAAA